MALQKTIIFSFLLLISLAMADSDCQALGFVFVAIGDGADRLHREAPGRGTRGLPHPHPHRRPRQVLLSSSSLWKLLEMEMISNSIAMHVDFCCILVWIVTRLRGRLWCIATRPPLVGSPLGSPRPRFPRFKVCPFSYLLVINFYGCIWVTFFMRS
jgi:hypothetical protein